MTKLFWRVDVSIVTDDDDRPNPRLFVRKKIRMFSNKKSLNKIFKKKISTFAWEMFEMTLEKIKICFLVFSRMLFSWKQNKQTARRQKDKWIL